MKTPEDEAFDELARKQGAWGGGFKAKQAMAKARVEDDDDIQVYKKPWVGLTDEEIDEGNRQSWVSKQAWQSAVWWASEKLKEKNT
jgi:hypothetical protein